VTAKPPGEELLERISALELELRMLRDRVALLETHRQAAGRTSPEPAPPVAVDAPPPKPKPLKPPPVPRAELGRRIEELVGGRLLALVGGAAIILGAIFFFSLAIERGWIGETARVLIAAATSTALLAVGVWLQERRRHTQAALAAVGAAVAALYLTLAAAAVLYELVPLAFALPLVLVVGATATVLALRWNSRTLAGLGILGSLVAPGVADALNGYGMTFLVIALGSAAGILVWRRWDWLAVASFAVAMPQVAVWTFGDPRPLELVPFLSAIAVLTIACSLGYELRSMGEQPRRSMALLVSANALVAGALGYYALPHGEGDLSGGAWLVGIAIAHAAGALPLLRNHRSVAHVLLAVALTAADVAFGVLVDGAALPIGWALAALALAALARRLRAARQELELALGGQLVLAVAHVLLYDAPPESLEGGDGSALTVTTVAAIAVCAFGCARLATPESDERLLALDAVSLAAFVYATALALDGTPLVLAFAGQAILLAELCARKPEPVAAFGAPGLLLLASGHVLAFEAPPIALRDGVDDLAAAALALGAVAGAAARLGPALKIAAARTHHVPILAAGLALLYLGSVAIVDSFQPGGEAIQTGLELEERQQGQLLLSMFWSICGAATVAVGLARRDLILRLAGFALLGLAAAKVAVVDLSQLDSVYRVLSLIVLGLLFLTAAYAYQRLRPRDELESP
jgi:uncharacterized membrane protein